MQATQLAAELAAAAVVVDDNDCIDPMVVKVGKALDTGVGSMQEQVARVQKASHVAHHMMEKACHRQIRRVNAHWDDGCWDMAGQVGNLLLGVPPSEGNERHRVQARGGQSVPSELKEDRAQADKQRKRLMNCFAHIEARGLHVHPRRKTAAGADRAEKGPPPRNPLQSPHFRETPAPNLQSYNQQELGREAEGDGVIWSERATNQWSDDDANGVETLTLSHMGGCRREARLDMATRRERSRLDFQMSRSHYLCNAMSRAAPPQSLLGQNRSPMVQYRRGDQF